MELELNPPPTDEDFYLSSLIPYGDNSPLYQCYDEEGRPLWKQSPDDYFDYSEYLQLLKDFGFSDD